MDASSIITQVSRDDELGQFNNGKGRCLLTNTACRLTFFFLRFSSRCWVESAPVTGLHRTPPHLTSPNFTSHPVPLSYYSSMLRFRRLFSSRPRFCLASPRLVLPRLSSSNRVSTPLCSFLSPKFRV